MRALHLFANFKWTGPADPAIRAAAGLRALGADVLFAQATYMHGDEHRMARELARARMPVTGDLELRKHFHVGSIWRDAGRLAARLRRGDFDLLHTHLPADHLIGSLAKRRSRRNVLLLRTLHDPEPPARGPRARFAFANTDGVVVPTESCARQFCARFGVARERVLVQEPTTDPHRFTRVAGNLRHAFGFHAGHFAIGITARIQPHRRFEFLWEVARQVVDAEPNVRFVLLGRGNEHDTRTLVRDPIARLGLVENVVLPGYLYEPDYTRALASLDLFTFLVPGSDGSCRAVREALAAGLPVVATKRGILPELLGRREDDVAPEPCGLLLEDDAALFATGIVKLIRNPEARTRLRDAALLRTARRMDPVVASRALLEFYARLG
ncbi:MAG: glycosyltransferase family 4 protein [Planctomycetes bacterium]|nr:glycosyltransferase family 4 protein [Planctomycetota bacterium]MCB9870493.1 glycosyltransferase family 4 protein [Planctomycetota bacterium]